MLKLLSFSFDNKKIRKDSYLFPPHVLCYLLPLADFHTCYLSLIFSNLIMMYLNMVFSVVLLFVSSTGLQFSSSLDKFNCNFFESFFSPCNPITSLLLGISTYMLNCWKLLHMSLSPFFPFSFFPLELFRYFLSLNLQVD